MREFSFFEDKTENCVVALGFFDAVHKGHARVLTECVMLSKELNATPVAFTFDCNPADFILSKADKLVCTYEERLEKFSALGIKCVLKAPCTKDFFDLDAFAYLSTLVENFGVRGIVCGRDYTFGKNRTGTVEVLKKFCVSNGVKFSLVDELSDEGQKIGSTDIKKYIQKGDMEKVNFLLGYNFSIKGKVVHGRGDGKKSLFPTVNLDIPSDKVLPKKGVYFTKVEIDGVFYKGITNVGEHPTFNDFTSNIETFILDFDGELYGKTVAIEFLAFLRDVKKFDSIKQLKIQIGEDEEKARGMKW